MTRRVVKKEDSNKTIKEEKKTISGVVNSAKLELENIQKEIKESKETFKEVEVKKEEIIEATKQEQKKLKGVQDEVEKLSSKKDSLSTEVVEKEKELSELKGGFAVLEQETEEEQGELNIITSSISIAKENLDELLVSAEKVDAVIKKKEKKIKDELSEKQSTGKEIDVLKKDKAALVKEIKELTSTKEDTEDEYSELKEESQKELDRINADIRKTHKELEDITKSKEKEENLMAEKRQELTAREQAVNEKAENIVAIKKAILLEVRRNKQKEKNEVIEQFFKDNDIKI